MRDFYTCSCGYDKVMIVLGGKFGKEYWAKCNGCGRTTEKYDNPYGVSAELLKWEGN